MPNYYDWQKTLSYDADVTMVIGNRGVGKTYGLRKQCVKDFIKDGSRFVEIVRFQNELFDVADGYYDRIKDDDDFKDYEFRTDKRYAYIAKKPAKKSTKLEWRIAGYFLAMTTAQQKKKKTFNKVRRIILDEAVLERTDRFHNYLTNEFSILANIVDTVSRERADTDSLRPRVYLLGNACDIANPYFAAYHVPTNLKFGYSWHAKKTFLLHYVDSGDYGQEKLAGTVAGRMMAGTTEGMVAAENKFVVTNDEFIQKKPSTAKFMFGVICNGKKFGIWVDMQQGYYHVSPKIPKNTSRPVYSLTRDDYSINYVAAKRADPVMKSIGEMWYMGLIMYENIQIKIDFGDVLELFGVR